MHQNKVGSQMSTLGIETAVCIRRTHENMTNGDVGIRAALKAEVEEIKREIKDLEAAIAKKGSWKRTNAERREAIQALEYRIKDLTRYIGMIGKERIPTPAADRPKACSIQEYIHKKYPNPEYMRGRALKIDRHALRRVNEWKSWFRKPNGKIKEFDLTRFLREFWHYAPKSLDRTKAVLGVKGNESVDWILSYRYAKDLDGMIPDQDSADYILLKRWFGRLSDHPRNTLLLDKLHAYLVNKQNRRTAVPRVAKEFPINERLLGLENVPNLRLIKNDNQLRAEGRRQSHCIGSRGYIEDCLNGYHALNYKGYTFFLTPSLGLVETHGRHNTPTPESVEDELIKLIDAA